MVFRKVLFKKNGGRRAILVYRQELTIKYIIIRLGESIKLKILEF